MNLIKEKAEQVHQILNELDIDCWLIFVRETPVLSDPVKEMVLGFDVTWYSFFIFTKDKQHIGLVGDLDADILRRSGIFTEVNTYTETAKGDLLKILDKLNPKSIAVNYSTNDVTADGLSHGLYLLLQEYLKGTPYENRLISAESIIPGLRSRKLNNEVANLKQAAILAEKAWQNSIDKIQVGMTEIEIARLIESKMKELGVEPSFATIVNAGDKTSPGHGRPTEAKLAGGDLLHIDFGVKYKKYCSDLQRLMYFRRKDEAEAPLNLVEAFEQVKSIITETGKNCLPGTPGFKIDAIARKMLTENGYEEYPHALGHQLGRSVHDGGGIIGPRWERYGISPTIPLELNNVSTLELEINLPGIGCVGLEEDMVVTETGAEYLCPRQTELIVK